MRRNLRKSNQNFMFTIAGMSIAVLMVVAFFLVLVLPYEVNNE